MVLQTLLQIVKAYSIIVNGGYDIDPTLIKQIDKNEKIQILEKMFQKKIFQF